MYVHKYKCVYKQRIKVEHNNMMWLFNPCIEFIITKKKNIK